jgi:hypothetical protein
MGVHLINKLLKLSFLLVKAEERGTILRSNGRTFAYETSEQNQLTMNPASDSPTPTGSHDSGSFKEFLHSWRYFLVLVGFGLLVVLFFVEENWRGHWAWSQYQRAAAGRNEPLTFASVVPPKVPDDKNLAMTPFLAPLFQFRTGSQGWGAGGPLNLANRFATNYDVAEREIGRTKSIRSNSWVHARTDLPAWYTAFLGVTNRPMGSKPSLAPADVDVTRAATGILASLTEAEPVMEELRQASQLPYSRFNVHYDDANPAGILLPHLAVIRRLCKILELRACAELALNQTEAAFQDVQLMLHLADSLRDEPIIISTLVRMTLFQAALQPFSEGLQQWSQPQLQQFQRVFAGYNFLSDANERLKAERVWGAAIIDYAVSSPAEFQNLSSSQGQSSQSTFDPGAILFMITPSGWFEFEKLNLSRLLDNQVVPLIDVEGQRVQPQKVREARERIDTITSGSGFGLYTHHLVFAKMILPSWSHLVQKAAMAQTAANCASLAAALELYRRAHQQLPGHLKDLTPELVPVIPHDVVTGADLQYRRLDDSKYLLYSVGWNEVDDGGVVESPKLGEEQTATNGDWVWRCL